MVDGVDEHAAITDIAALMHASLLISANLFTNNNVIFLLSFLLSTCSNNQLVSELIDELGQIFQQWRRVRADFLDALLLHENR